MVSRMRVGYLSFWILLACAAPSGSDPAKDGYLTPDAFCAGRAEAECQAVVVQKCGGKDADACSTKAKQSCLTAIPQGTRYLPQNAAACIEQTRLAYQNAQLSADAIAKMKDACARVFSGPGAARAPCTVDADCSIADSLKCLVPLAEMAGKCLVPNVVEQGGPCANEADVCTPDFFCDAMKKQCTPKAGMGESCYAQHPCAPGLKCNGSLFVTSCGPLAAAGTPCSLDEECASGLCNKAKSTGQGTCVDSIVLSPLSAACAPFI